MATIPTFTGDGGPILSLTSKQCMEYALFLGDNSGLHFLLCPFQLWFTSFKAWRHWDEAQLFSQTVLCVKLKLWLPSPLLLGTVVPFWAWHPSNAQSGLVSISRGDKYAVLISTGNHLQLWLQLNPLISLLWGQMGNYWMHQTLPGTMIQTISIQFHQCLLYKVCLSFTTFQVTTHFLSDQVYQRSYLTHATAGIQLAEAITAEKLNEYDLSCCWFVIPHDVKASAKRKWPTTDESHSDAVDTNTEDKTFAVTVSDGGSNGDSSDLDSNNVIIRNKEVWSISSLLISAVHTNWT